MDVDTLLTRQMELHTSVRHPPKNPQSLVQLMDIMRNYKNYFESLRKIAGQFSVEPETVFQAFMYISVGGSVNFDRQHQDGSVPMHQAKVLARTNAIELSSTLRKELPNSELMVYVGLSRDLRTTLRVKVEDGNDLKTAEASVREAVEYLNYIDRCAHHNPEKLFQFYMAEDPTSLATLLGEADPLAATQTVNGGTLCSSGVAKTAALDESGADTREPAPLPTPLSSFLPELTKQCELASETSSVSGSATRRLKAAQIVLDWVTAVPTEYFAGHAEKIVAVVSSTLSLLATEKRSALCRVGCEVITILVQRLSPEPVFLDDVDHGTCSTDTGTFSGALVQWTASLTKGTYVTVAAISTAADKALRAVAVQSHGHICVVKKLLAVLAGGTQTELRRKCLGYLALCATAAHAHNATNVRELIRLVGPVAVDYVAIGDSPSRKMARALCSVLRVLDPDASPTCRGALAIADERVEHLVQQERSQVELAVTGGPQDLEELLFEADAFVSSMRSSFSNSTPRNSGAAAGGRICGSGNGSSGTDNPRGRGRGAAGVPRTGVPSSSVSAASSVSASAANHVGGIRGAETPLLRRGHGFGQPPLAKRTPAGSGVAVAKCAKGHPLGELRSPTRRGVAETEKGVHGAGDQRRAYDRQRNGAGVEKAISAPLPSRKSSEVTADADDGVFDTDSFLGSDMVPKKDAKSEHEGDIVPQPSTPSAAHVSRGTTTYIAVPVLPTLSAQPLRGTATTAEVPVVFDSSSNDDDGSTGDGHRRNAGVRHIAAPQLGSDRPVVPLSLRDASGGRDDADESNTSPGATGEPAGAVRISRSLRRKIDGNKTSKEGDDGHRMR